MANEKINPIIKDLKVALQNAIKNDINNFTIDEIASLLNCNAINKRYDYLYNINSEKDLIQLLTTKKMRAITLHEIYEKFELFKKDYPEGHTTYFFYNVQQKTFSFVNTIFIKTIFIHQLDEIVNDIIKKPFVDKYKLVYQKYISGI